MTPEVAPMGSQAWRSVFLAVQPPSDPRSLAPRPEVPTRSEAAVTMVVRDGPRGLEFILIERAKRDGDPWSGQMALPGGRKDPEDATMAVTALRELQEEVGVRPTSLEGGPIYLGERPPANRPEMSISVFLAVLKDEDPGTLATSSEVNSAYWAPLSDLIPTDGEVRVQTPRGPWSTRALMFRSHVVWGFTRRVLLDILETYRTAIPGASEILDKG